MMSVTDCPKVSESAREWHDEIVGNWARNDASKIVALSDLVQMLIAYIDQNEEASR